MCVPSVTGDHLPVHSSFLPFIPLWNFLSGFLSLFFKPVVTFRLHPCFLSSYHHFQFGEFVEVAGMQEASVKVSWLSLSLGQETLRASKDAGCLLASWQLVNYSHQTKLPGGREISCPNHRSAQIWTACLSCCSRHLLYCLVHCCQHWNSLPLFISLTHTQQHMLIMLLLLMQVTSRQPALSLPVYREGDPNMNLHLTMVPVKENIIMSQTAWAYETGLLFRAPYYHRKWNSQIWLLFMCNWYDVYIMKTTMRSVCMGLCLFMTISEMVNDTKVRGCISSLSSLYHTRCKTLYMMCNQYMLAHEHFTVLTWAECRGTQITVSLMLSFVAVSTGKRNHKKISIKRTAHSSLYPLPPKKTSKSWKPCGTRQHFASSASCIISQIATFIYRPTVGRLVKLPTRASKQ